MSRRIPLLAGLAFLAIFTLPARAEWMAPVVSYQCDHRHGRLQISYERVADQGPDFHHLVDAGSAWGVADLILMGPDENGQPTRAGSKHIVQQCRLADGFYKVDISAYYTGSHMNGECGGWITGSLRITRGQQTVYPGTPFEAWCNGDKPVIQSVTVRPGNAPRIMYGNSE